MTDLGIVGISGRFKPLHKEHAELLIMLCKKAKHIVIGLGSCNRYNLKNPFTAEESAKMIDLVLKPKYSNYSFINIPDFDNGPLWRENVIKLFGKIDYFVTENDYVINLLKNDYKIINSLKIVGRKKISSTNIRDAILSRKKWKHLVPERVAKYLKDDGLIERFCKEFNKEIIGG